MDRRPSENDPLAPLSKRERIVAERFAEGLTYRQIGEALYIAPSTVRTHIATIYRKLAIQNKSALVRLWVVGQNDAGFAKRDIAPNEERVEVGETQRVAAREDPVGVSSDDLPPSVSYPSWRPSLPTIAVLPFFTLSGNPAQEWLTKGVVEDIETDLSRFHWLRVVAVSPPIVDKPQRTSARDIGRLLGAHYLLVGSVRHAAGRMRFTVRLVEAATGTYLWAERYEGGPANMLGQDGTARTVALDVARILKTTTSDRVARKLTEELSAYDHVLIGESIDGDTKENNHRARQAFQRAIELTPSCAVAYAGLAQSHAIDGIFDFVDDFEQSLDQGLSWALKAASLDTINSKVEWVLAHVFGVRGDLAYAEDHFDRAIAINSMDTDAIAMKAFHLVHLGRYEESIFLCTKEMQVEPQDPCWYKSTLAYSYYANGQYREAIPLFRSNVAAQPYFVLHRMNLAATYAQLGRIKEAQSVAEDALALAPDTSLTKEDARLARRFDNSFIDHRLAGLRRAGIPE